jgi:hypothetical protein
MMDEHCGFLIPRVEPELAADVDVDESTLPRYPSITTAFLFAGKAHFEVVNPKGERLIYLLHARGGKPGSPWAGTTSYFLSVFNTVKSKYEWFGIVDPDTGAIKTPGRAMFLQGSREHDVAAWAIMAVINRDMLAPGYLIKHKDRCGVCGKTLVGRGDRDTGFHLHCVPDGENQ